MSRENVEIVRAFAEAFQHRQHEQFDIEDVRDAGDDQGVLLIRNQRQWGRHSGIEVQVPPHGLVFTLRDGKVVRWCAYPDQRSALEAVGLSE